LKSTWLFEDEANFLTVFVLKENASKEQLEQLRKDYLAYFSNVRTKLEGADYRHPYFANTQVLFDCEFMIRSIERATLKDVLISDYHEDDYGVLKQFVRDHFGDIANLEIYPFSRNIKLSLPDDKYLNLIERQLQAFLSEHSFKQRPTIRVLPRNERRYSQSKVLLVFFVPNKQHKHKDNNEKFYNMLRDAQEQ
jgi:hypothetical protein